MRNALLGLAVVFVALSGPALAADALVRRVSVIDGDTPDMRGTRIRLHGVDAPESQQTCERSDGEVWRCGQEAANALDQHVAGRTVSCSIRDRDRYQRYVAVCTVGGEDLNAWLAETGRAAAYRTYSMDYVEPEERARRAQRGIWSGKVTLPWDWRRQQREPKAATAPAPAGCAIKGNINAKGRRLYHLPGGRDYERTAIDTAKGERWFCSEAEARAAGWQKAGG